MLRYSFLVSTGFYWTFKHSPFYLFSLLFFIMCFSRCVLHFRHHLEMQVTALLESKQKQSVLMRNLPCLIPKFVNRHKKSQRKGNAWPLQAWCSFYQHVAFRPRPSSAPFPGAEVKVMHIKVLVPGAVPE